MYLLNKNNIHFLPIELKLSIKDKLNPNHNLKLIDHYKIDGDFVESQAFAYLAIRSFLNLPITFPNTTGCELPSSGGILANNF